MRLRKFWCKLDIKRLLSDPEISKDAAALFSEAVLSKKGTADDFAEDVSKDLLRNMLAKPALQRKLAMASDLSASQKEKILMDIIGQPKTS